MAGNWRRRVPVSCGMLRSLMFALVFPSLVACQQQEGEPDVGTASPTASPSASLTGLPAGPRETIQGAHGLEMKLPPGVTKAMFADRDVEALLVQVLLDHTRHSPGVIDGYIGSNVERAIREYRQSAGLPASDAVDAELLRSLLENKGGSIFSSYTISDQDVRYPFRKVPQDYSEMSKMERVGYETPVEMLAERFHMDQDFLAALNPGADFTKAGTQIAIVAPGDEKLDGTIARIEVRKASNSVVALDAQGEVLASYPASIGSGDFPSPSGTMKVVTFAPQANYTFDNEKQEWGPEETYVIPAGPNNPVGGVWIDLSKSGYGIHGSPDPQLIGKTMSHGCVRLTNWDARELGDAVTKGVEVTFI